MIWDMQLYGARMDYITKRLRDRAKNATGYDKTLMLEAAVVIEGRDRAISTNTQAEIAEADRRAGLAERRLENSEHENRMHRIWTDEAKRDAGFRPNTSFDDVWAACLAAYREKLTR